jgi:hypothetical protein
MGFVIIDKEQTEVPFETVTYIDNPKCKLGNRSFRKRTKEEKDNICAIVVHSTAGIPGGKDLREQVLYEGSGESTNAGSKYAGLWQNDTSKFGGTHFVVDFDGMIYQCCDAATDAAYHAGEANGHSIGIEVCQDRSDASFYNIQLEKTVELVLFLTEQFNIPKQTQQLPYDGPTLALEGKLTTPGIFGHRNLTNKRGAGDPGDFIIQALIDAGVEQVDFGV